MKQLAVDASEILFVGDEKKDMECARNAGVTGVLINRSQEVRNYGQDYTISSLKQIINILDGEIKMDEIKLVEVNESYANHINHPILGTWGGHCGYTVRPSERGNRYAIEMLRLNIENARELGIDRLLVICSETNPASEKTILANGGVFENTIEVDGCTMKRYWIIV